METDTLIINNREEFAQWAIARANAVLEEQGSNLAKTRPIAPIRVMNPTS